MSTASATAGVRVPRRAGRLFRNLGWLGVSEAMGRVSRLVTAIALARVFLPEDFGIVATALTTHDLVRALGSAGLGIKIIQALPQELQQVCTVANRLNWIFASALFVIQSALAYPIALAAGSPELGWMIFSLAFLHLMFPWSMVSVFLVQRANGLRLTGLIGGSTLLVDNIATAALAIAGFGVWSVIVPRFASTLLWVLAYRAARPWAPTRESGWAGWQSVLDYSWRVFGVEVLKTLRVTLDKPLIGLMFGVQTLGIYYFSFNAGLGISQSILGALSVALLPHLCDTRAGSGVFRAHARSTLRSVALTVPLIILAQALAVPFYVPILFGTEWASAVPVVMVLCLSAMPRALSDACSQILRAAGRPGADLAWNVVLTVLLGLGMAAAAPFGLIGVAWSMVIVHVVAVPVFVLWTFKRGIAHMD
ncbi:oligosaccharide flippase family protein [Xanthobacter sp. KR7-65]|uniref:oligosaccharide flippase family protein n=1 Tax=Xanthobacter sp. KR7-65 TaxID=3156612 RepID=UPI0032B42495